MAFMPGNLLADPLSISLFDDDSNYLPLSFTTLSPRILNSGSARPRIPRAPTPNLIEFAEQSSEGKLYDEIYQKNLLKFLATGGFAVRKTAVELSADAPVIHSIIDEPGSINGCSDSLIDQQESIAEGILVGVVDYDGGSSTEFEFEPRESFEVEDELLMCLSDGTIRPPLENSMESDSVWSRLSVVGELVNLSDEVIEPTVLISQENFNMSCRRGIESDEKPMLLSDEAEPPLSDGEDEWDGGEDSAGSSQDNIGPNLVQSRDAEMSAESEDCTPPLSDLATSDYLASESSSSREELNFGEGSPDSGCPSPPTHHSDARATTRRLVKINLPDDTLHKMHEDPRFIGVCHAWVKRPDLCKWGANCVFSHEYPPALAQKYGMIAVYVKPNGKEVKNVTEFLKLEEAFVKTQYSRPDEGAKIHSQGCYKGNCRAFLRNECPYGDKCRFKHPKSAVERGKWVTRGVRKFASGKHRTYCKPDGRGRADTGDIRWRESQSNGPAVTTVSPKLSPTVVLPSNSDKDKDYNYWGEEIVGPDAADYWVKSPPAMIEQAYVAEAMTCKQLLGGESHKKVLEDFHIPHAAPRAASGFPVRAEPAETGRGAERRKILEKKYSLSSAEQEKKVGQNMIDIPDMRKERVKTKGGPSRIRQNKTHDTKLINDGYDTADSDSGWIKSLKEMLALKCEPTRLKAEEERGSLIDFN